MRNNLTGAIPTSIGKLQNLRVFELNWNRLSGLLPSTLCNSSQLYYLDMGYNNLEGNIPTSLRNCQNMEILFLDHNKLNGSVPENVIDHFNQLRSLYLQQNTLTGSLPADFGQLKNLNQLLVSDNNLSGEIPRELGSCSVLEYLDMARNSFQGNIPLSFSSLGGIQILDLSCNNLSGMIPKELQHLSALLSLNLSYSYIEGEVPSGGVFKNVSGISITGNKKLCGGIPQLQLPACSDVESAKHGKGKHLSTKIVIAISITGVSCPAFIVASVLLYGRKKAVMKSSSTFLRYGYLRVSYKELLKATSGFAYSILIGMGSFGSVYKGILSRGERPVAVKVLNLQQRGAAKSFMAECKVLRNIQQRNLLRIITSCSSVDNKGCDFKALVFEFMPNGNLDSWLHHESRNLSFRQRLDIAIDVANALDYLHHQCQTPIVHGDLKPSNVLLDDDMVAYVGDFGLAKLIPEATEISSSDQTSSALLMASIGYVAPGTLLYVFCTFLKITCEVIVKKKNICMAEYGIGGSMWPQGDMYSYGILFLQMLTGRRPIEHMFSDGLSLHSFSKMALPERVMEIADSTLVGESGEAINNIANHGDMEGRMQDCLASIARIGVACSEESPGGRMDIKDVVMELNIIKEVFLGVGIHGERHIRMQLPPEGTSQLGGD
uniref:non-specific serine/threonine protein kinase n=1 Tax=Vitis vinifera TaxID=29760 RepID=F6GWH4_VITVI